jgi:hypothetical protein
LKRSFRSLFKIYISVIHYVCKKQLWIGGVWARKGIKIVVDINDCGTYRLQIYANFGSLANILPNG